jgi:tetratricopeptide (TPR) repeat protein
MPSREEGAAHKRRRLRGVEIRPGSVREARQEAGLSLAGVAGQDLTRAAIHLIETGRARPSMPTLELISRRTGKPVSFFLASAAKDRGFGWPDSRVLKVQQASEMGDHQLVLEEAPALLEQVAGDPDRALIMYWLGLAHVQLRQSSPAFAPLRQAGEIFERLGDRWMVVECLDAEAGALHLEHDARAREFAERALELCRTLDPRPAATESRILGHLGLIHASQSRWDEAIDCYDAALEAAAPMRDLGRMAKMYLDLSRIYEHLGRTEQQLVYSQRALALNSMLNDRAEVAMSSNNLGMAYLKRGDLESARRHLGDALAEFEAIGLERGRSHVYLSIAELHLGASELDDGEAAAKAAIEVATRLNERHSTAVGHQMLARIAAERGDNAKADAEFEEALTIFTQEGAVERVIECHSAYAEVLEARGDTRRALWHARKALAVSRPRLAHNGANSEAATG